MDTVMQENPWIVYNPFIFVLEFMAVYGWYLLGASAAMTFAAHKLAPRLERWRQEKEDAAYHKDPEVALARMQAVQEARERQQRLLEEASVKALQEQKEREERKRAELVKKLKNLEENGGHRLGAEDDYLPLSGGASTSSYRAPKRSACSRGGCGR